MSELKDRPSEEPLLRWRNKRENSLERTKKVSKIYETCANEQMLKLWPFQEPGKGESTENLSTQQMSPSSIHFPECVAISFLFMAD